MYYYLLTCRTNLDAETLSETYMVASEEPLVSITKQIAQLKLLRDEVESLSFISRHDALLDILSLFKPSNRKKDKPIFEFSSLGKDKKILMKGRNLKIFTLRKNFTSKHAIGIEQKSIDLLKSYFSGEILNYIEYFFIDEEL